MTDSSRLFPALLALLCLTVALRLWDASHDNARTTDESVHIASGMEWLERHTYYVEELHPPLARVLEALPLYLKGIRMNEQRFTAPCTKPFPVYHEEITAREKKGFFNARCLKTGDFKLLYQGNYLENLHAARLAGIGWMILGALYLYALTAQLANRETALAAMFVWSMLPLALAHAGLATTDLPGATSVIMAMAHAVHWSRRRTWKQAAGLGAAFAVCGLVKFSALVYAGALFVPFLLWTDRDRYTRGRTPSYILSLLAQGAMALLVMLVLIWAGYRFSLGRLADVFPFAYEALANTPDGWLGRLSSLSILPMPEWFMGWEMASLKNAKGHATYLLGEKLNDVGVWYFFPVALWFKTPLSVWALTFAALALGVKKRVSWLLWPTLWCLIILGISMTSNINLGARHILPLFPFLCMIAAAGGVLLWRHSRFGQAVSLLLFGWLALTSIQAHPQYIPFFNSTAGDQPQRILVDSDLAWGQDFGKLVQELNTRDLYNVLVCSPDFPRFKNYPVDARHRVRRACPEAPPEEGWLVINYNTYFSPESGKLAWLSKHAPVMKIGSSYELYRFGK